MKKILLIFPILFLIFWSCEEQDTTPPTVSIQSPITNQSINEIVTIVVETNDNEGISKVEFYIDDSLFFTDLESPYEYEWNTTQYEDNSEHIVKVISYDNSDNSTTSQPIMLIVDNSTSTPNGGNITSVTYTLTEMTVEWEQSSDGDFKDYKLLYSETGSGDRDTLETYTDISTTSYTITEFDPLIENWFWVQVTDTLGLSSIGTGMTNSLDSEPTPVNVTSVTYDLESMTITWEEYVPNMGRINQMNQNTRSTVTNDFVSYELLQSDSEDGTYTSVTVITDQSTTSHSLTEYDPTQENWFKVKVTDYWNLTSTGNGMTNEIDSPPTPSELSPIVYENDSFTITWSQNNDDDFQSYKLYESLSEDMSNDTLIYETDYRTDTTYFKTLQNFRYYQIVVEDVWGLQSTSNIEFGEYDTTFTSVFGIGTGKKLIQSNDEGYIIGGETYEGGSGSLDYILIKADESGNHETTVMSNDGSRFGDIALTSDNGFVVTGMIYEGNNQAFIKKLDLNGNIEWENYFWTDSIQDIYSIKQTEDLGYILTGRISTDGNGNLDVLLIKSDTQGNQLWLKSFDNGGYESASVVHQTSDGGYILMGYGESFNWSNHKFLLIKTDSDGNEIWRKTFGGNNYEVLYDGKITNDGGYVLAGVSSDDIWLIKTDSDGNEEWNRTYGGSYTDSNPSVDCTIDGGYIIISKTNSHNNGADYDPWLFKVDALGNVEWELFYGDDYNNNIGSVIQSSDGGYAFITDEYIEGSVGASNTRIKLIKTFGQLF